MPSPLCFIGYRGRPADLLVHRRLLAEQAGKQPNPPVDQPQEPETADNLLDSTRRDYHRDV